MTVSTISTTLSTRVTPGSGNYAPVLDITQTGAIVSPGNIYIGVLVNGVSISNSGSIYGVVFQSAATLTNYGSVGASLYSVNLQDGGLVNNFGTIGAAGVSSTGIALSHATLNNYGVLSQAQDGVGAHGYDFIDNFGTISALAYGVFAGNNSTLENSGTILSTKIAVGGRNGEDVIENSGTISGGYGVLLDAGVVGNTGSIAGGTFGIDVAAGGTVVDSGMITGGVDAIKASGAFVLTADPGANFSGAVVDSSKTGTLQLGGSLLSSLDMGGSFSGFKTIDFTTGARWTLEGSIAELAAGETINGFAANDTLVLDGFIASSSTVAAGVGLVLSNGFSTETLDITGSFAAGDYTLSSTGGGTEIQHTIGTINTTIATVVTPGKGNYSNLIDILSSGAIVSPGEIYGSSLVNGISVLNHGQISTVYFIGNATLTNYGTVGHIETNSVGVSVSVDLKNGGTVNNFGTIMGSGSAGPGIELNHATLNNYGLVSAVFVEAFSYSSIASNINNFGNILGEAIIGSGVTIDNAGIISATSYGISGSPGKDFIINSGEIDGNIGVGINNSTLINYGSIESGFIGVLMFAGSIENAGIIAGETAVSSQLGNFDLRVDPGAEFIGIVTVDNGQGILELAAGTTTTAGSLNMGGSFSGFNTIDFDAGSSWSLQGSIAELAAAQTINGFTIGDTLVLDGFTANSANYLTGAGLELSNGTITETLGITGDFSTSSFMITDTAQGTEIVVCYLRGTRIATAAGERAVEALAIGDAVLTRFGGVQKIKWIGRQSFAPRFIAGNSERIPVRIKAGALGGGLPRRDLFVSPGHSMLLKNTLVLAKALVNGLTITQEPPDDDVHYHLIEFETHDCVQAEGAWSESFADGPGLRNQFHNVGEFLARYPAYRTPDVISLCAERPDRGARLAKALRPVVARARRMVRPGALRGSIDLAGAVIEGWAQDAANPRLPVMLEILAKGRLIGEVLACDYRADLAAAGIGAGRAHFVFQPKMPVAAADLLVRRRGDRAEIHLSEDGRRRA